MSKRIIALGGGNIGDYSSNYPPLENIINEMIRLSGKERPTLLFLAHTYPGDPTYQNYLYKVFRNHLQDKFDVTFINTNELGNDLWGEGAVMAKIDEADIIYEIGGDTFKMINFWQLQGFDMMLRYAYNHGKIMSGFSAGANCWFEGCSSDYLQIEGYDDDQPLMPIPGLGFHEGFFVPHSNKVDRVCSAKRFLRSNNMVGLLLADGAALEIVDDQYRILTGDYSKYNYEPHALKCYWKDEVYYTEELDLGDDFKPVSDLLSKNPESFELDDNLKRTLKK